MKAKVIQLGCDPSLLQSMPESIFHLRWRLETATISINGPWTPQTRYPSLSMTLKEYANRIDNIYIDAMHYKTGRVTTLLSCPGFVFLEMTYKGMLNARTGLNKTIGIEVVDRDNNVHLVLVDGTVYQEKLKNANNNG